MDPPYPTTCIHDQTVLGGTNESIPFEQYIPIHTSLTVGQEAQNR